MDPNSNVPSARIPKAGAYIPSQNEFFVYGGQAPNNELRADDQYTDRSTLRDIWKFSFANDTWEKIGQLDSEYEYYHGSNLRRYGRINKVSGSFFSEKSKIWYIPTTKGGRGDLIYFVPVNTETEEILSSIPLDNDELDIFITSNFLFDQKSSMLMLVGIEKATGVTTFPIKIIEIPEDSLLVKIEHPALLAGSKTYIYGGVILILIIGFIFYLRNGQLKDKETSGTKIRIDDIEDLTWLKEEEKRLLNTLIEEESSLESDQLEKNVWEDVENYDYRRKLRNETIKQINKKFKEHFGTNSNIVERIKDPEDNRRYLYKINDDYIDPNY